MTKDRQISKIINLAVKEGKRCEDIPQLDLVFSDMSTNEIEMFWTHYSAMNALRESSSHIPDYQTKKQEKYFMELSASCNYKPKKKDLEGKYIIDKDDLIVHIKAFLIREVNISIDSNLEFKNKSFIEKLPSYLLMALLFAVPIFIICSLFPGNRIATIILATISAVYGLSFFIYLGVTLLAPRKKT